jgi:regulator of protease activity HflC (stomatin/prohibitin superfamily)
VHEQVGEEIHRLLTERRAAPASVVNDGVWHSAQPMLVNVFRPALTEVEPPGVVIDGVGGARKRMKIANASILDGTSVTAVASKLVGDSDRVEVAAGLRVQLVLERD